MSSLLVVLLLVLGVIAVVSNLFDSAKRASTRKAEKLAAASVRPGEQREDVVQRHLNSVRDSSGRYAAQDATVSALRDVMVSEGAVGEAPEKYERLNRWQRRSVVRQEYKELANAIEKRMRERLDDLAERRRASEQAGEVEAAEGLKERNKDLIETFFKVAERKIAARDEYGDEKWDELPSEIERCVIKVGDREGVDRKSLHPLFDPKRESLRSFTFDGVGMKRWLVLAEYLDLEFRRRHATEAGRPRSGEDVSRMDGVEFETYVANVLAANGFDSVRGTPMTGDQGADLIAEKDGRAVIIQAKRYQRPIGNKAVQEVIAARTFYKGDEAWVVTNSTFTPSAVALAQSAGVRLVDGVELSKMAAQPVAEGAGGS